MWLCSCPQTSLTVTMTATTTVKGSLWKSTRASSCICCLKFDWAWTSQRSGPLGVLAALIVPSRRFALQRCRRKVFFFNNTSLCFPGGAAYLHPRKKVFVRNVCRFLCTPRLICKVRTISAVYHHAHSGMRVRRHSVLVSFYSLVSLSSQSPGSGWCRW